jgi:hypothetical protein
MSVHADYRGNMPDSDGSLNYLSLSTWDLTLVKFFLISDTIILKYCAFYIAQYAGCLTSRYRDMSRVRRAFEARGDCSFRSKADDDSRKAKPGYSFSILRVLEVKASQCGKAHRQAVETPST